MTREDLEQAVAARFHEVYLMAAGLRGWKIRPEVHVPYDQLSEDAQFLDLALAREALAMCEKVAMDERVAIVESCASNAIAGVISRRGPIDLRSVLEEKP